MLWDASFSPSDVITLSQSNCAKSSYTSLANLNKPMYLKDLASFAQST